MSPPIVLRDPVRGEVFGVRTVISTKVVRTRQGAHWKCRCACGLVGLVSAISLLAGEADRCAACAREKLKAERDEARAARRSRGIPDGLGRHGRAAMHRAVDSTRKVDALITWMRGRSWVTARDIGMRLSREPVDAIALATRCVELGLAEYRPGGVRDTPAWRALPVVTAEPSPATTTEPTAA